jgi:hypothetical protein
MSQAKTPVEPQAPSPSDSEKADPPKDGSGRRQGPLHVPLQKWPWWQFKSGEKTVETRAFDLRWLHKHVYEGREVLLKLGYPKAGDESRIIHGTIGRIYRGYWAVRPDWVTKGANVQEDRWRPSDEMVCFEVLQ